MSANATLAAYLVGHLLLTALPMLAGMLAAAAFTPVRSTPLLLAIGLCGGGLVAMLTFWAFYVDPLAGQAFCFLVAFGSLLLCGVSLRQQGVGRGLLRELALPLGLWACGATFLIFLGFVHGGSVDPISASAVRFIGPLPTDNDIPRFFAGWFFEHGGAGTPPVYPGEWLSSDRPPLQIGYVLSQRPVLGWDDAGLHYQVLGVALQQLWIVGLWALLLAARVGRVTRALTMTAVFASSLVIVSGFYVWPKLLPAAMLLAATALVATPLWETTRRSFWGALLLGGLLGLAMLGHGSTAFAAIPLALLAVYRGLPGWRWAAVAVVAAIALMAPWTAYQRYGDPPGDRLAKWQIGGVTEIDNERSAVAVIVDSYREAGLGEIVDNKLQNFLAMAGAEQTVEAVGNAISHVADGEADMALRSLRAPQFFHLLPSLGLLLLAPALMLVARLRGYRRRSPEWGFALVCLSLAALGALCWGLLLFGNEPGRTVIHAGSYLVPILAVCGCVAGLTAIFPRVAVWLVAGNAALTLALYAPPLDPPPGSSLSVPAALLAALALVGFVALLLRPSAEADAANTLAPR